MTTVDARGLACPLPLTMAKRRMTALSPGEQLEVLTTDPEASIDLVAWAFDEGHPWVVRQREAWAAVTFTKLA